MKVRHTFYAADGSSVACVTAGEAADAGDKATAKAQSVAYKLAVFETLCVPIELHDPDNDSPESGKPKQRACMPS